jgi:hypothetical protein
LPARGAHPTSRAPMCRGSRRTSARKGGAALRAAPEFGCRHAGNYLAAPTSR